MAAAIPFMLGQQGDRAVKPNTRNKYATNANTRDESQDRTKFPLHRLSRNATPESENARHQLQEDDRVKRMRESLRSLYPNSGAR